MKRKPEVVRALAMIAAGTHTVYAAAKVCKVSQSTLHRALARDAARCPTCGGPRVAVMKV